MQFQRQLLLMSENVNLCVTAAVSKLMKKSPIVSVVVRNSSALDPKVRYLGERYKIAS